MKLSAAVTDKGTTNGPVELDDVNAAVLQQPVVGAAGIPLGITLLLADSLSELQGLLVSDQCLDAHLSDGLGTLDTGGPRAHQDGVVSAEAVACRCLETSGLGVDSDLQSVVPVRQVLLPVVVTGWVVEASAGKVPCVTVRRSLTRGIAQTRDL